MTVFDFQIRSPPSMFYFRPLSDVFVLRIYFLSSSSASKEATLFYVDVSEQDISAAEVNLPWNHLFEQSFQVSSMR